MFPVFRDVVLSAPLSAATVDYACYPCTTILSASPRSRLTFMSLLRPMSYIPHLVHVSLQLIKSLLIRPPPTVRCCVLLRDVLKKYTTVYRLGCLSFFLFHFFFVIWAVSY